MNSIANRERSTWNPLSRTPHLIGRLMGQSSRRDRNDAEQAALDKVLAIIEFTMDGRVLYANQKFLETFGYSLTEIQGQHHGMFVDPAYRESAEYKNFWQKLGAGQYDTGEYKRFTKDGKAIWIQSSYNPILNGSGKPCKVIKYATDITAQKMRNVDFAGQIAAINRVMEVIEFSLDGTVLTANENFLKTFGYTLDEVRGKHHRLFVTPSDRDSQEYRSFWQKLGRGECNAGQFKRVSKTGQEVWIEAFYNPILDADGKPYKVVKYATNITEQQKRNTDAEGQMAAVNRVMAVIEFALDGTVLAANDNFLKTFGYTLEEVRGQHHRMFVPEDYRNSADYRQFWEKLGRAEFSAGKFQRVGKHGKGVWIEASYNPILGADGKPYKVVKYATDITAQISTQHQLEQTLSDLQEAVAVINSAVREISSGNEEMASRTQTQAASLQKTASSMEQLTGTVKQNSDNARLASELAVTATDVARRGSDIVNEVNGTMEQIYQSSKRITEIIGVIDGIAFQTNILALNAAVEAARAGEQGRGFGVVASEVRNLAQRCAGASKEIRTLIVESSEKVEAGTIQVRGAGDTMNEIVASTVKVSEIVGDIAAASEEQSIGLDQINTSIVQIDESTQQNATLVREVSESAMRLEEQAAQLYATTTRRKSGTAPNRQSLESSPRPASHESPAWQPKPATRARRG